MLSASLGAQLKIVQDALAEARANNSNPGNHSHHLDTINDLNEQISDLETSNQTLTMERDTARIETKRAIRDLKATQDALSQSQRIISELQGD